MDRRIQYALGIIANNYGDPLSLGRLARDLNLSPSRFAHLFKQHVGQPFKTYLKSLRLKKAAELLQRQPVRISEVAHRVGYGDPSNFSRDFRQRFRKAPRAYGKRTKRRLVCP